MPPDARICGSAEVVASSEHFAALLERLAEGLLPCRYRYRVTTALWPVAHLSKGAGR